MSYNVPDHFLGVCVPREFYDVVSKAADKNDRLFDEQLIAFAKAGADAERMARPAHVRKGKR